jgi:hypothetical protein
MNTCSGVANKYLCYNPRLCSLARGNYKLRKRIEQLGDFPSGRKNRGTGLAAIFLHCPVKFSPAEARRRLPFFHILYRTLWGETWKLKISDFPSLTAATSS